MASYRIEIKPLAEGHLFAIHFPFRRQINQKLFKLKSNPRPLGAVQGLDGSWRWPLESLGSWIIVYDIDDTGLLVTIIAITQ